MATRTNDLTEFAKPVADRLAAHCGSLKRILSAGVIALDNCSSDEREMYMALAIGARYESSHQVRVKKSMLLLKEALTESPPGEVVRILSYEESDMLKNLLAALPQPDVKSDKIEHRSKSKTKSV